MAIELFRRLAREISGRNPTEPFHWRAITALDRGPLGEASIAMDHQGRGIALWENGGEIWSISIGPGSAPALVRLPQGEGRAVDTAMNQEGKGVALWSIQVEEETHILGMMLDPNAPSPTTIYRTVGKVHHLQVAMDRRGNAFAIWLHEIQDRFEILGQAFDARTHTWKEQSHRFGLPSTRGLDPRLTVNQGGLAMVLWHAQTEDFDGLVACHYLPSKGVWSEPPMPVAAGRTALHRVSMDKAGNANALWIHPAHGERSRLESATFDAQSNEWEEPITLARAHFFSSPQLTMAGNGKALAAWCQAESSGAPRLFAKAFNHGSWEDEVERVDSGKGLVRDFTLAMGSQGRAGLLSLQQGREGYQAMVRWRDSNWSSPSALGATTKAPLRSPRLIMGPQGAIALWTLDEGRERILYASVAERNEG